MDIYVIEITIARYIIPVLSVLLDLVALWNDHFLPPATSQKSIHAVSQLFLHFEFTLQPPVSKVNPCGVKIISPF